MNPHNAVVALPNTRNRQTFLIFAMMVAGKTSGFAAERTRNLIYHLPGHRNLLPFKRLCLAAVTDTLASLLYRVRTGRYAILEAGFRALPGSIDVDRATYEELVAVPGVGPKTASYYLMYAKNDTGVAAVDTHIRKFLRECGVDTRKSYPVLRDEFLARATMLKISAAELDNYIWRHFARGEETGYNNIINYLRFYGNSA